MNDQSNHTIRYLVSKSLEGCITEDEIQTLDRLIIDNASARRYYVEFLHIHMTLRQMLQQDPDAATELEDDVLDRQLWDELARYEQTAESIETASSTTSLDAFTQPEFAAPTKITHRVSRLTVFTFAASLAALLLVVLVLNLPFLNPVEVATVTDSINAEYAAETIEKGSRLTNRKGRYYLLEGISSVRFDSGADVVIEGPAEFELKSSVGMVLFSGRVYAHVPRQAIGFTVETLDSRVIDLGTEFGVYAVPMQGTELHVFEGKTQMVLPRSNSMLVTEGQAQRIEAATGRIQSIALGEGQFVRKINSDTNLVWKGRRVVSLSDLILGGDGYGSSEAVVANFDPNTGNAVPYLLGQYQQSSNDYRPVASCRFLDGVFVPNGSNQVVSSEGHVFTECPDTSGAFYHGLSFDKNCRYFPHIQDRYLANRHLDFAGSAIFVHSNAGVTVDLDAIRHTFAGQTVNRFRTSVGTAFSSSAYGQFVSIQEAAPAYTDFDVWIVVDGRLQQKIEDIRWNSLADVDVPIISEDRFLSIIVTDGHSVHADGNVSTHYDLCALADPRFEVECME